ncbi:MAG TPA: helix-turn-helix transcriptional regulator [Balneolales bacterium]|nr:helix-turn-helix transcriptional regulator [Balneolales bacterium]
MTEKNLRLIFGLKLRQYRHAHDYSLQELADRAGMSPSYLNEIEKGKKYPKVDKIMAISKALDISFDDLVSLQLSSELNPLSNLLNNDLLDNIPFELFGIDTSSLVDLMSEDPAKFNALIGTLVEIARNYDVHVEHFFFAALRSYQETHHNYFPDLENKVDNFRNKFEWQIQPSYDLRQLEQILIDEYHYEIQYTRLNNYPDLKKLRSIYVEGKPNKLEINDRLMPSQKAFVLGREIGFNFMNLKKESVRTSTWIKVKTFRQVMNNFKASYFSGALLLNRDLMKDDLAKLFNHAEWKSEYFQEILKRYDTTPETLLHRLTQLVPHYFGLNQLYFLRFYNQRDTNRYHLTKELHFSRLHSPHGIELDEHYCRRWITISIFHELNDLLQKGEYTEPIIRTQRSHFFNTNNEYFNLTLARPLSLSPDTNSCVTMGFRMNTAFKRKVKFWNDQNIHRREVNETCERCPITDCEERVADPIVYNQEKTMEKRDEALHQFVKSLDGV